MSYRKNDTIMDIIYNPAKTLWNKILCRPTEQYAELQPLVTQVFKDVKQQGNKAIADYTLQFDKVSVTNTAISKEEITEAIRLVSDTFKKAVSVAKKNIETFHKAQKTKRIEVETTKGVFCYQEKRPIEKIGIYIPGGTAPLFSTILMLAIPASIASCQQIVMCSPPNKEGRLAPEILYTASVCGITDIFKVGGIQAIAGMTFGTETIPNVYKIFGPGNQYVTLSKQYATQFGISIDMPAGPSELLVVADNSAVPEFVASDLLSQAEHGVNSQVILIGLTKKILSSVKEQIQKQILELPRKEIALKAMANSKLIYIDHLPDAIEMVNQYAPEHLIIVNKDTDFFISNLKNAGSVFIGNYTPESAGDYASGTNHTLPTNGFAKNYSGVNLDAFLKVITFQRITKEGILNIGKTVEVMAEAESLTAHKAAVSIRLKKLTNDS